MNVLHLPPKLPRHRPTRCHSRPAAAAGAGAGAGADPTAAAGGDGCGGVLAEEVGEKGGAGGGDEGREVRRERVPVAVQQPVRRVPEDKAVTRISGDRSEAVARTDMSCLE